MPYRDNYVADLMAGRVSFVVQAAAPLLPQVAAGHLRGLALLSAARLAELPEVPTTGEAATQTSSTTPASPCSRRPARPRPRCCG